MKSALKFAPLAAAILLIAACGQSHESLLEEMTAKMEELAEVVDSCKTIEDAEARKVEITEIAEDLREIAEKARELDKPSKEEEKALEEKYGPRLKAARAKIEAASQRIVGEEEIDRLMQDALRVSG